MKKILTDWKLLIGFCALLILITTLGLIGIFQIQALTGTIEKLGQRYFPMQKTTLEMKNSNNLYAMGIRNYAFWKGSRYLEVARAAANLKTVQKAAGEFNQLLDTYSSYAELKSLSFLQAKQYKEWAQKVVNSVQELQETGVKIINLVDQNAEFNLINRAIMLFESQLYKVNDFLDVTFQEFNLKIIKEEIELANSRTARSVLLLQWALVFGILIGSQTAAAVYLNRRHERQRRERLVRQMIILEEEERKNLSFQVHDQMGQDLSALRIYLDLADKRILIKDKETKKNIADGKKILTGLMNKAHNISELLRPPSLDEIGLKDTIAALVFQYEQIADINFYYQKPKEDIRLSGEHSLILYRVAQEGLTNIIKHAQAKNVKISLELKSNFAQMVIQDDGVGFAHQELVKPLSRRKGDRVRLGIKGLKERIELLGGTLNIKSSSAKGTKLTIQLPI
ncbi:MAG: sensor histidine kinase [Candidatus Omnitrophota bacterium]